MAGLRERVDDRAGVLARREALRDGPQRVARAHDRVVEDGRAALGSCEGRAPERDTRLRHHEHQRDPEQHRDESPAQVDGTRRRCGAGGSWVPPGTRGLLVIVTAAMVCSPVQVCVHGLLVVVCLARSGEQTTGV